MYTNGIPGKGPANAIPACAAAIRTSRTFARTPGKPVTRLVLRIVLACVASGGILSASGHGVVHQADDRSEARTRAATQGTAARDLTVEMLSLRAAHAGAKSAVGKAQALAPLVAVARQRQGELLDLVDDDPAEVLRVALPASTRGALPAEIRGFIEEAADETGEIEVLHVDHVDGADDHYLHYLNTRGGRYSLHFAGAVPDLSTGSVVSVRGVRVAGAIVVAGRPAVLMDKAIEVVANTKGPQRTLAILVNFGNDPSQPYTVDYARNVMFGATSAFDYEASYQQTTVEGDVAGWFTIAASSLTCDVAAIATQAKAAAASAGYALSGYARLVYVFPSNACSWWGMGTVGGSPSQAWIHTKYGFSVKVVGHEMGHNLGLFHSHSLDCGSASVASSGCAASEYGDLFDLMGSNSGGHFNAAQKERLGWLNDGLSPPLTTVAPVAGTATFDIAPLEDPRNALPRALKIPRTSACGVSGEWFYVEARQAKGYDAFLSGNANVLAGVLVRKVTDGQADSSYLLDMTPGTTSWSDAALVAGKSFTDPQSGLKIATVSAGAAGARVSVTFPSASCTRAAPKVTITPGDTAWTSAGASVTYTVTTQNQDSCGCSPTNYDVSAAVPAGWSATNARTPSVAPGGTSTASVLVTTPSTATAGFYPVTMKAANVSAPAMADATAGTVAVESTGYVPPAPVPPSAISAAVSTDRAGYSLPRWGTAYATATTKVTAGGAAVGGAAVAVEVRDPGGKVSTLYGTTGSTGVAAVAYAIRSTSLRGTYKVTARATGNGSTASATTSFTVN